MVFSHATSMALGTAMSEMNFADFSDPDFFFATDMQGP